MKEKFVLDACALLAFLNDETGAEKVENILTKALDNISSVYMNKLNIPDD